MVERVFPPPAAGETHALLSLYYFKLDLALVMIDISYNFLFHGISIVISFDFAFAFSSGIKIPPTTIVSNAILDMRVEFSR
jgi:hypothetical protein